MAISVLKRPYQYCFSGNPVHYELHSSLAAGDPSVQFELRVLFKHVSGDYTPTPAIPFSPVNGTVKADIKDILESLLSYELPTLEHDTAIQAAPGHTGFFYIQFREITATNQSPTWDNGEEPFASLVVKGGMSHFKYQGNNFWVNYFMPLKPFLTWQLSGRMASLKERMYLLFLNTTNAASLQAEAKAYYTDGTSASTDTFFSTAGTKGMCLYIPAGAKQWELEQLQPSKKILYWEIAMFNASTLHSERYRFVADNRPDEHSETLHYRSSLGSLDSVRIRGVIEEELAYEFTKLSVTQKPDYYNGHFFSAQERIASNNEIQSWIGDIGYIPKEDQDRLRDAYMQRETWWEIDGKWWPVNITTTKNSLRKSTSKIFSLPITWKLAHGGDRYYTPRRIAVGSAVFESNVCMAYVSNFNITYSESSVPGMVQATISFDEHDPQDASIKIRYRLHEEGVITPLVWTEHSYAPIVVNINEGALTKLYIQSICENGIFGRITEATLDRRTVEVPDDPELPAPKLRIIVNNTFQSTTFAIFIAGQYYTSGTVDAQSQANFSAPDLVNQTLTVKLMISPAYAMLSGSDPKEGVVTGLDVKFGLVTSDSYIITLN